MDTSSSRTKSNGHKPISHSSRFCSSSSSTFSTFPTRPGPFLTRSSSPTRINLYKPPSPSPSVSATSHHHLHHHHQQQQRKRCACSPTTHPGSFRCSLHRNQTNQQNRNSSNHHSQLNMRMRRSAMTNSLVRIGTVEGELLKRALSALIRPSSHQLRRRGDFQTKPSRLSTMSKS